MDYGQYQYRQMNRSSPSNLQYDENSFSPPQEGFQTRSYDGFPQSHLDTSLLNNPWQPHFPNYTAPVSSISSAQDMASWTAPVNTTSAGNESFSYGYTFAPQDYGVPSSRSLIDDVPRSLPMYEGCTRLTNDSAGAGPSSYITADCSCISEQSHQNYRVPDYHTIDDGQSTQREGKFSISQSLNMGSGGSMMADSSVSQPAGSSEIILSDSSGDGQSSREMTIMEPEDLLSEEPYAKLIYRALMSAPDHSMVLQEIYQWFRENTTKGSSDTKGWMNSIRHNLSMNAAFKKTERRIPGDEVKKSTEWVLEDFAIKDGVQSTTRYRKGTGNKKFVRPDQSSFAMQISDRKNRYPQQRMKDVYSRPAYPQVDTGRRPNFNHNFESPQPRIMSPVTPGPSSTSPSPYFLPSNVKFESADIGNDDIAGWTLNDVSGIYDDSPVFANDVHFHNAHSAYINNDGIPS